MPLQQLTDLFSSGLYYVELFGLFLMECGHVYQCMQLTFFPFKVKIYEAYTNSLFLFYTTSHNYVFIDLICIFIKSSSRFPLVFLTKYIEI